MRSTGAGLVLLSAAAFGAMPVLGTLAYREDVTVGTLLVVRFVLAAAVLWAAVLARPGGRAAVRALGRRDLALALALGACGYAGQAGGFFAALERIDAALLSLLLYTYPAMVAVAAVLLGRERLERRRVLALVCTSTGLVLVLAGAGTGALDPLGVVFGVAAACIYTAYILTSEGISGRVEPLLLTAIVCSGAAATLAVASAALGDLRPEEVRPLGWLWLAGLALVSTVAAIGLFFAGLRRAGPTAAAILSTAEPLVTVLLAFVVLGEVLTLTQAAGGAAILAGVLVLHARGRRPAVAPV